MGPGAQQAPASCSVGFKKRRVTWFRRAEPFLHFLADSSKELEELRSAFARALDYLKQEVEERKCASDPLPRPLVFPVLG